MNGINTKKMIKIFIVFFTVSTFSFPVYAKEKEAGKTLLTRGSVIGKRSTGNVTLKRRSVVFEKDEIHVGNNGRAQFRMVDQAIISLQQNSVLKIKKYQFKKGAVSNNSALLELVTGGLRTITGLIGKGNKKSYELRTPLATIGVRGTDYEVEIVSNGMYVATWAGVIQLKSRLKGSCNMLVGRSQPFMFVFIDRLGNCKGLRQVPKVFSTGHSSNVSNPKIAHNTLGTKVGNHEKIEPLQQNVPVQKTYNYRGLNIDQSRSSVKINSNSNSFNTATPTFKVGLDLYSLADGGQVSNFEQSVGGYKVSWGHWNAFSNSGGKLGTGGMIWTAYEPSDISVVSARTGTFRYENVANTLLSSSAGQVNNFKVQMDVNFESGNVTNGALSANTSSDTWIAVFDGAIKSGNLGLQLNGASVIDSNSATPSPIRDASGFISGDFVGNNAEAIIGGFGLTEDNTKTPNHIEGTFLVK